MDLVTVLEVVWTLLGEVSVLAALSTLSTLRLSWRALRALPDYRVQGPRALYQRAWRARVTWTLGLQIGVVVLGYIALANRTPVTPGRVGVNLLFSGFFILLEIGLTYITLQEPLTHARIEHMLFADRLPSEEERGTPPC